VQAYRQAFSRLELLVVIDKDMTETAELADYVLPAATQFEKHECTFFNWGFPANHLHVRHPVLPPTEGTLPEPEIYHRLVTAMGEDLSKNPLLGPISQILATAAFAEMPRAASLATAPLLMASMMFVDEHEAAVRRAGVVDEGEGLATALFKRIITSPSGAVISVHEYEDTFRFIRHPDGRIHLAIEPMLEALAALGAEAAAGGPTRDPAFPFVLCAGERRASNATTSYRDPAWRSTDRAGALRISRPDAERLAIADGDLVSVESRRGSVVATAELDDTVQPGAVSLPHGFGLTFTSADGTRASHGPLVNLLSASDHCDPFTKVPYHKSIPVRIRKLGQDVSLTGHLS